MNGILKLTSQRQQSTWIYKKKLKLGWRGLDLEKARSQLVNGDPSQHENSEEKDRQHEFCVAALCTLVLKSGFDRHCGFHKTTILHTLLILYIEIKADWLKSGLTNFLHTVRWQGASCRSWAKKATFQSWAHGTSPTRKNVQQHRSSSGRSSGAGGGFL